jgi:Zn-dependent M28 family amino/carboxypeptidase
MHIKIFFKYLTLLTPLLVLGWIKTSETSMLDIESDLHEHIKVLSQDSFLGRGPATEGERLTLEYLTDYFQGLGIASGNDDSYLQEVSVTETTAINSPGLHVVGANFDKTYQYGSQVMLGTQRQVDQVSLTDSELIFVGYGINAPERGWNDYEGIDVTGKTVIVMVNDPGYQTQDPELFNGNRMTYYGRWTYKYAEAARQGAASVLIIHETGAAAYGWNVVENSWSGPQISLTNENQNIDKTSVIGWLTNEVASELFEVSGFNLEEQILNATTENFEPISLGDLQATTAVINNIRTSTSNNFIAVIPGSDRPEESIIYTAHWDHLGVDETLEGDNIYNGAIDNGSGTAALMTIAKLFSQQGQVPNRSIVFLAVTAEESGLLGSQWYAEHPIYSLPKTVANINMDGINVNGPMRDVVVVGDGSSELEELLTDLVDEQEGRYVASEPYPERGYYYRSDHFNFARVGIPAIYFESVLDHFEYGQAWGEEQQAIWNSTIYHSPNDEYNPDWDLSGAVLDIELYYNLGKILSEQENFPEWYEGNEFKSIRDLTSGERQP